MKDFIKNMRAQLEYKMTKLHSESQGRLSKDKLFQAGLCYVIEKNRPQIGPYFFMTSGYDEFVDGAYTTHDIVKFVLDFDVKKHVRRTQFDNRIDYPDHKKELQEIINSIKEYLRGFMGLDQPQAQAAVQVQAQPQNQNQDPNESMESYCLAMLFTSESYAHGRERLRDFYTEDSRAPKRFIETINKVLDSNALFWRRFFRGGSADKLAALIRLQDGVSSSQPYLYGPHEKECVNLMVKTYQNIYQNEMDEKMALESSKPNVM
jgi:hypothetical protein